MWATIYDQEDILKIIIKSIKEKIKDEKRIKEYINAKNRFGMTALTWAKEKNRERILWLLKSEGADTSELNKKFEYKYDDFIYAIINNLTEFAFLVIEKKLYNNKPDKYGRTPIIYAAKEGNISILEYLIKHGAKVDKKDGFGKTALDYAKNNEVKQILLEELKKQKQN